MVSADESAVQALMPEILRWLQMPADVRFLRLQRIFWSTFRKNPPRPDAANRLANQRPVNKSIAETKGTQEQP